MSDNGSLFNDDDLFGSAEPVVRETRQPEADQAGAEAGEDRQPDTGGG